MTRYTSQSSANQLRILQTALPGQSKKNTDWFHGHYGSQTGGNPGLVGVANYFGWQTDQKSYPNQSEETNWLVMCGQNGGLMLANGVDVRKQGSQNGSGSNGQLLAVSGVVVKIC